MAENLGSLNASIRIDGMDRFLDEMDTASKKVSKLERQLKKPLTAQVDTVNTRGIKNAVSKPLSTIEKALSEFDKAISNGGKTITKQMVAYNARYKTETGKDFGSDKFKKAISSAIDASRLTSSSQTSLAGVNDRVMKYFSMMPLPAQNSSGTSPSASTPARPTANNTPGDIHVETNSLEEANRQLDILLSTQEELNDIPLDGATDDLASSIADASEQASELSESLKSTVDIQAAKKLITSMKPFENTLDQLKNKVLEFGTKYFSLSQIITTFKEGAAMVQELDKAFTKMRLASSETLESLKKFQAASFDIGRSIGVSALSVQASATSFLELGHSLQEAEYLSENANIYSNISGLGIEEATNYLNTAVEIFGDEFNNKLEASSAIINRYAKIGRSFGISSADIGSAVADSAQVLAEAGSTLNQALSLLTEGSLTSLNLSSLGNAIDSLSQRMKGAEEEYLALGEKTNQYSLTSSKLRQELLSLANVDIRLDNTNLKSAAQVISEISENWENFTPDRKIAVLEVLSADDKQKEIFSSLLENAELLKDVQNTASNAGGSAAEANAQYVDSVTGKTEQLKTQLQELATVAVPDDLLKGLLDTITKILKNITDIISVLGPLPTLLAAIGSFSFFKNFGRPIQGPALKIA